MVCTVRATLVAPDGQQGARRLGVRDGNAVPGKHAALTDRAGLSDTDGRELINELHAGRNIRGGEPDFVGLRGIRAARVGGDFGGVGHAAGNAEFINQVIRVVAVTVAADGKAAAAGVRLQVMPLVVRGGEHAIHVKIHDTERGGISEGQMMPVARLPAGHAARRAIGAFPRAR